LNVPPDARGLIAAPDQNALAGMHRILSDVYGHNLLRSDRSAAKPTADAAAVTDGTLDTYWASPNGASTGALVVTVETTITFNRIVLQEPIQLGQRIASFRIEAWTNGAWTSIAEGTTVGYKRILSVPLTSSDRIRVTVLDGRGTPLLAEVGVYRADPVS
jgi:alpha-L-fucosidase